MQNQMLLFGTILFAVSAFAQKINDPAGTLPEIEIKMFDEKDNKKPAVHLAPNAKQGWAQWSRLSGGVYGAYSNRSLSTPLIKISSDEKIVGQVGESQVAFGFFIDTPVLNDDRLAYRFRLGIGSVTFSTDDSSESELLEVGAQTMNLDATIKMAIEDFENYGYVWGGGGLEMNFAFAGNASGVTNPESQITNSLGLSPHLSLGWDWPVSDWNDFSLGLDLHVPFAIGLILGFRSTL